MKTKEQILKECKERIQGKLSMLYWNTTIYEAMDKYATQQVNLLNKPAVSINEGSNLCVSVAVMDTLQRRLATIQSETDRMTRETMIESFLVDITEC